MPAPFVRQRLHGLHEDLGAVTVAAEHVQAGTGRAQQHGVAGLRLLEAPGHGRFQRGVALDGTAPSAATMAASTAAASRPIVATARAWRARGCGQRREVLAFAVATEDDDEPGRRLVGAQAVECSHRGADIRALAVVVGLDIAHGRHPLHAVRLAGVFTQAVQHGRQGAADGGGQRQRGQRVRGVVATPHAQRSGGHEALEVDLCLDIGGAAARTPRRLVGRQRTHQPGHAVFDHQAEVARPPRCVQAEAQHAPLDRLALDLPLTCTGTGAGTMAVTRGSSPLTTITACAPKMRALAAA